MTIGSIENVAVLVIINGFQELKVSGEVNKHKQLISNSPGITELVQVLSACDVIAFDTEFIRDSTFFPKVEIIQLATEKDSWIVDVQAFQNHKEELKPLLGVFTDRNILKVAHAIQGDQESLLTTFGVVASPSIDTAIAASFCGYGDSVGLAALVKEVLGQTIKKGHARTNWSVRPLPDQLIDYALADVEYLVVLWKKLAEKLEGNGRKSWALQTSQKYEDPKIYAPKPEELALKIASSHRLDKKGFAALVELVQWRELRVREANLPRRWVADDNVLLDLARVKPKDLEHLKAFRGLNKGEIRNSGQVILEALERASKNENVVLPERNKFETPSEDEAQVLDLLKCYLGIKANRLKIASRHLAGANQLLNLIRSKVKTVDEIISNKIMSGMAADLVGKELISILDGKIALSVKDGRIEEVEIK